MIKINIPGYKNIQLKYLVLDYNGTLAVDGQILDGVYDQLKSLADKLEIHVITADTFGKAHSMTQGLPCKFSILSKENQDICKRDYVKNLGGEYTVSIGNGLNDRLMLEESAVGMTVILGEGAAVKTLIAGDIVFTDILLALDILQNPLRLTATLRL